jgi:tRNA dimethylallyltransferase
VTSPTFDPAGPSASPAKTIAPLVAILGPTAAGKSALAVVLAQRFAGEVIACDSTQVYRGFDIGTAKPTAEERCGIAHHLMDLVEPSGPFTAGEYRRRALEVLSALARRERLPIFTVGTGLYWRALLEGLADAPERCEPLRARLDAAAIRRGNGYLHRLLQRLDAVAAARISSQDRQKLVRAVEVCLLTGQPLTELHRAGRHRLEGYAPIKIGLAPPRAELRERIERRVHAMLERGWHVEVEALLARQTPAPAKPFEFIGYRELRDHLQHGKPLPETVAAIVLATRQYAKRQLTWFRKEPDVHWFAGCGDDPETQAAVGELLAKSWGSPLLAANPPSGAQAANDGANAGAYFEEDAAENT